MSSHEDTNDGSDPDSDNNTIDEPVVDPPIHPMYPISNNLVTDDDIDSKGASYLSELTD